MVSRLNRAPAWLLVCAFFVAICLQGCGPPRSTSTQSATPFTVKIIGLNDYHGHLQSPGTFAADASVALDRRPPVGGADFLAAHVARLKARNPLNIVVGAGDFIGASPLISGLFHDEPSIETLNRIGLELNAVGNHEFDRGWRELLRLQGGGCKITGGKVDANSCRGAEVGTPVPFEGAMFQWLAANVVVKDTGRTVLPAYGVKSFQGVRIAFIGMTLAATPAIVTPTGVEGLEFRDEAQTVNALVPHLRAQGIEAIVVLVHEGGVQTGDALDINGCEGELAGSPIAGIVARLDDAVDLVLSGHTHAAYNCRLANAIGRRIPVTSASAFGRVLTDIDVTIDPAVRDITQVQVSNRLVDRSDPEVVADANVRAIVDAYSRLVEPIAKQVIGSIVTALPAQAADAACNSRAGELVADAQLAATAHAGLGGAVVAFVNPGGVRAPGFTFAQSAGEGDGNVTYGEAFTVQPFGNSLVTMTLTVRDIRDALEQQFAGCQGQSASDTRIMTPSAGFTYTWDGSRPCGERVRDVRIALMGATETLVDEHGKVPQPLRTLRVTVNSYMAEGGDSFAAFRRGTARQGGPQDLDALVAHLQSRYQAPHAPYDPSKRPPSIRRVGGTTCPRGANVNP